MSPQVLFNDALNLPPDQRVVFLNQACGGDAELRREVEALLRAHEGAGSSGAATSAATQETIAIGASWPDRASQHDLSPPATGPGAERAGTVIGRYKLLELIGQGGFGSVFLAEQEKPVVRRVALKIIKLGMDTRQVIARFEAERQALALMDHPNIAKVLDAGATETGRPYFVMELVKGERVTEYCDSNDLTIPERLQLLIQVCQAVQHAHQKGIIHRDLKPSNVLVSTQDGRPHVKVIDFGIAKATGAKLTEKTLCTEFQQFLGTPQYMSPEQAEGSLDIDTRTDVYSLGVILYELLVGVTPFNPKSLRSVSYFEIQRVISELDPEKPSTRLARETAALPSIAARRRVEPRKLGRMVRGDLDWIVMKALEHDRTRRYESANGLATDVQRYLSGDAVVAAPPSTAYRARKFVRRNKGAVLAAGVVAAALVLGVIGTSVGLVRAEHQRRLAVRAREDEAAERKKAEAQRDKAQKIAEFMSDTLEGVGPSKALGRDTTMLKEMMDGAAQKILNGELKDNPEAEVKLRQTIGNTLRDIAEYEASQGMLGPALELARTLHPGDDPSVATGLITLASLLQERGDLAGAEPLYREALEMNRRLFPSGHPDVAESLNYLALLLQGRGDFAGAEPLHREALEMRRRLFKGDHQDMANGLDNLAVLLMNRGDLAGAEPLFREAVDMYRRLFRGDHPNLAAGLNNLASLLQDRNDLSGAEALYREGMEMCKRLFPGDHPEVAASLNNLATLLQARGDLDGAEPLVRESLGMYRRLFPGDHPNVASSLGNLGRLLQARGDLAGAEPVFGESLEMYKRLFDGDHPNVAIGLGSLASLLQEQGDLAGAERLHRQGLEMFSRLVTGDHPITQALTANLGWCLSDRAWLTRGDAAARGSGAAQAAEAEALLRECLASRERILEPGDWQFPYTRSLLGAAIMARAACDLVFTPAVRLERLKEAEALLTAAHSDLAARADKIPTRGPARLRQAAERLVRLYTLWDRLEPGTGMAEKAAAWNTKLDESHAASGKARPGP